MLKTIVNLLETPRSLSDAEGNVWNRAGVGWLFGFVAFLGYLSVAFSLIPDGSAAGETRLTLLLLGFAEKLVGTGAAQHIVYMVFLVLSIILLLLFMLLTTSYFATVIVYFYKNVILIQSGYAHKARAIFFSILGLGSNFVVSVLASLFCVYLVGSK